MILLLQHYLDQAAQLHGLPCPRLTPDAVASLMAYPWPGNVRELRNIAERLVLKDQSTPLTTNDVPSEIRHRSACFATDHTYQQEATLTAPPASTVVTERMEQAWRRIRAGEDFWTVVQPVFRAREFTRTDLASLIDRGLREAGGSYRALLTVFHLPPQEYKRFHAFLYQQRCNLPVSQYRQRQPRASDTSKGDQKAS